ncbi:unnamed protein product [Didymodactylos carnosus]|uniref:Uncharacterized protein n=1 Tax=Didymodactylos carnosus TaxID=1234261 RepID=A0A814LSR4_9BILA|nr:unnamed protein product [Didymodactylos carnosus]CAF1070366.1 unnamed protein product [Didymodactylos carnosus]CAF3648070.1 unnamed protein product [Didymodactylos carnosus]CAF3837548.1 unnamed protein product [Didymodactylos carnosus]
MVLQRLTIVITLVKLIRCELINDFRPPSIPLFILNPSIAVWMNSDNLTDRQPQHWIETLNMTMVGYIRINQNVYRFLGVDTIHDNHQIITNGTIRPMQQISKRVQPTQTKFLFQQDGIELTLEFTQPAFPELIHYFSCPIVYITHTVRLLQTQMSNDDKYVQLYFDFVSDFVVNNISDQIIWEELAMEEEIPYAKIYRYQSYSQLAFVDYGDSTKPNWGHLYISSQSLFLKSSTQTNASLARQAFLNNQQQLPNRDPNQQPQSVSDQWPVNAYFYDYGLITQEKDLYKSFILLAYDDLYSMNYYSSYQQPYWKYLYNNKWELLLKDAYQKYAQIKEKADQYDQELIEKYTEIAGPKYATLLSLLHRQVMGACVCVWNDKEQTPWLFMKEQSSGGAVSTVDVIFPASPFYLYLAPEAVRLLLLPILDYSNNQTYIRYNLDWTPHHLGKWPLCNVLPQEQEQMPIEETGNILIMLAAIAQQQQGQIQYLEKYSQLLEMWANYLNKSLPDPSYQLCTDDFEGPSAHNANLAIKGIVGLGAYSLLLKYQGKEEKSRAYVEQARLYAKQWYELAVDGEHFKLEYDKPNTWSQKYNLIWQYLLKLDLFDDRVRQIELKYYLSKFQQFGLPLDIRSTLAKCDSTLWIAALCNEEQQEQQQAMITNIYTYAHQTPIRQPISDVYNTTTNKQIYFTARPVMGGRWWCNSDFRESISLAEFNMSRELPIDKDKKAEGPRLGSSTEHDASSLECDKSVVSVKPKLPPTPSVASVSSRCRTVRSTTSKAASRASLVSNDMLESMNKLMIAAMSMMKDAQKILRSFDQQQNASQTQLTSVKTMAPVSTDLRITVVAAANLRTSSNFNRENSSSENRHKEPPGPCPKFVIKNGHWKRDCGVPCAICFVTAILKLEGKIKENAISSNVSNSFYTIKRGCAAAKGKLLGTVDIFTLDTGAGDSIVSSDYWRLLKGTEAILSYSGADIVGPDGSSIESDRRYWLRDKPLAKFLISTDLHQPGNNINFTELYRQGVTSAQLLDWSAPIDVAERYEKNGENSSEVFYNCSSPWFGPTCQYSIEYDILPPFSNVVQFIITPRTFAPNLKNFTIEDEQLCQILEVNECSDNEFRCHFGGQCIPSTFVNDGQTMIDCLDTTDEVNENDEVTYFNSKCIGIPTFRCEESTSRRFFTFPCGDDEFKAQSIPRFNGMCRSRRDEQMTITIFTSLDYISNLDCQQAVRCLLRVDMILTHIQIPTCEFLANRCRSKWFALSEYPIMYGFFQFV